MKKQRRTSEQVIEAMFNKLNKQGDIELIASNDPGDFCSCEDKEECPCFYEGDLEDGFWTKNVYRRKKKPSECFYFSSHIANCMEEGESIRFKFEHIEQFVKDEVKFTPAFLMRERNEKIDMVLKHEIERRE